MSNFTPGPWSHNNEWIKADPKHGTGWEDCYVAQVYSGPDAPTDDQAKCNGQLIALAPKMLAAIELALQALTPYENDYELHRFESEAYEQLLKVYNAATRQTG